MLKCVLWLRIMSILVNFPWMLEEMCFLLLLGGEFSMSHFVVASVGTSSINLLTFCLLVLVFPESEVSNYNYRFVCSSFQMYLVLFQIFCSSGFKLLCHYFFLLDWSFCYYIISPFVPCNFTLKSTRSIFKYPLLVFFPHYFSHGISFSILILPALPVSSCWTKCIVCIFTHPTVSYPIRNSKLSRVNISFPFWVFPLTFL